jgi:hypothetical protein
VSIGLLSGRLGHESVSHPRFAEDIPGISGVGFNLLAKTVAGCLRGETEIRLTPKEFELLSFRNHDRVLTHRIILKEIWGSNAVEQPEHLWTLVAQVRQSEVQDDQVRRAIGEGPESLRTGTCEVELIAASPQQRTYRTLDDHFVVNEEYARPMCHLML